MERREVGSYGKEKKEKETGEKLKGRKGWFGQSWLHAMAGRGVTIKQPVVPEEVMDIEKYGSTSDEDKRHRILLRDAKKWGKEGTLVRLENELKDTEAYIAKPIHDYTKTDARRDAIPIRKDFRWLKKQNI